MSAQVLFELVIQHGIFLAWGFLLYRIALSKGSLPKAPTLIVGLSAMMLCVVQIIALSQSPFIVASVRDGVAYSEALHLANAVELLAVLILGHLYYGDSWWRKNEK